MRKPDYFVLTQMIIDDVYFPWGASQKNQLGGGVYTVAGERIWSDDVGFCCVLGPDFQEKYSPWFVDNQIDLAGRMREKNCVHAKIHYFEDGEREEILQPGCGSYDEMLPRFTDIPQRYASSKGLYFYKDLEADYWDEALAYLEHYNGVSCWEIDGGAAQAENRDLLAACLPKIDLFSLNLTEGRRITGESEPMRVLKKLQDLGASAFILRMGANGALAAKGNKVWAVPAVPVHVVDATGGGNSSTGGFLVGYCESGGDVAYAARCGAVSASFIISQWSVPLRIDSALRAEAQTRLAALAAVPV